MLGVLSSIRHPPKILVFRLVFGCCGEMLQKSPKPIRKSFAPYKGGPSPKRTRMVGAWSSHGRRHGARGLIPEGKPYRALACGPITSGGRIYTLTRHSRPPGTPSRSFISFPSKFPFMSLHFLPLHCRFSSLHFLEDSFIRIPFPFRPCIFLQLGFSPAPSSFSCNAFDLHLPAAPPARHQSPRALAICAFCAILGLTRQAAEPPHFSGFLYVLYVFSVIETRVKIHYMRYTLHIGHMLRCYVCRKRLCGLPCWSHEAQETHIARTRRTVRVRRVGTPYAPHFAWLLHGFCMTCETACFFARFCMRFFAT